ncbi:hypothetical protein ACE2AJ_16740 [Aquihabitans daechungensis]|uniref:hypothetical protein n=1 Tax=Aquihabitans daechungensis TaxID=1052257 RepID=UPI003B9F71B4
MPANHAPKHRRSGTGRVTPKGTRPPGVVARPSLGEAATVDHHLDAAPPKRLSGRSTPPNAIRQRSGHRGGR